jgi:hypothetical protein
MSITINAENVVEMKCQEEGCKCVPIASRGLPVSIKLAIDNTMHDGQSFVVLPVFEIDGLKVTCELVVNENGMSLTINTYKMMMYGTTPEEIPFVVHQFMFRKTYIKKLTKYTLKDYETVIKHINNDIKEMKFDQLNGVFVTPQIKHPREAPHVRSNMELINSVPCNEKHPEECSVCLEVTKTTTPCGHKLCVSCWTHVKTNGRELPCPICRVDLFQSNAIGIHDVDHSSEEDESDDDDDSMDSAHYYGSETYEDHRWLAFRSR